MKGGDGSGGGMIHAGSGDTIRSYQKSRRSLIVRELLHQYFNIAFLMGKPQDLPAGQEQLRIGIVLALLTYVIALAVPFGVGRAILQAAIDLGTTGVTMWIALTVTGRASRFEQAFGGLCGASAFVNLAATPLYLTRPDGGAGGGSSLGALPDFVLLVWGLSLLAHVIRHTFEVKMAISVFISFIYFLLLMSFMSAIIVSPVTPSDSVVSYLSHQPFAPYTVSTSQVATTTFELVISTTRVL